MDSRLAVPVMFMLLLIPTVSASANCDEWTNSICSDNETLFCWENIPTSTGTYNANTTVDCSPFECNNLTKQCERPYNPTPVQASVSFPVFIILFLSGLFSLFFGVKGKHIVLTIWSTISFLVLAMQSVALEAFFIGTFFAGFTTIFIALSWLLLLVSISFTLVGMVSIARNAHKKEPSGVEYGR